MESHCKNFRIIIVFFVITFISVYTFSTAEKSSTAHGVKYVFKVKENNIQTLRRSLSAFNLTLRYRITPSTFIFEYTGFKTEHALRRMLSNIRKQSHSDKILAVERVREYDDTLKPVTTHSDKDARQNQPDKLFFTQPNLVCDNYYGMSVEKVWSRGYTGNDVTIAITDVGANTELLDLKHNINRNLSYNFVNKSRDVSTENFRNYQEKTSKLTDHGNKVASIIAATKGNNMCSSGIAYNATLIVLKVYIVTLSRNYIPQLYPSHWTRADVISRALGYLPDTIDIFANAWAPTKPFDKLDLATRNAIKEGATNGRRGFGTIYVVPSGPPGNELSNNIHTITVNSIGRYGTIPDYTYIDASVLTSGLGDGNNLSSSSMVTTTRGNRCITGFNGVSAATAQMSAIIGLALEANKHLSLRDIQHILVHASDYKQLKERIAFKKNAAGRYFHGVFGFGLLNADKLVTLALTKRPTHKMLTKTLIYYTQRYDKRTQSFEFCYRCDKFRNCLTTVEHVTVQMDIRASSREMKIAIDSPGGTRSVLMNFQAETNKPTIVTKLKLVTVQFWDERSFGIWRIYLQDKHDASHIQASQLSLIIQGTSDPSITQFGEECPEQKRNDNDIDTTRSTSKEITWLASTEENGVKTGFRVVYVLAMITAPLMVILITFFIKDKNWNPIDSAIDNEALISNDFLFDYKSALQ